MHTVSMRNNIFLVGYYREDWYDERKIGQAFVEVFRTPKESVAWGVCNFLNGSSFSIDACIEDANSFIQRNNAGSYGSDFYK